MMLTTRAIPIIVAGFALGATPAMAQAPRQALLVDAAWLMEHRDDPDVVVIDPSGRSYAAGHIPGARALGLGSISRTVGEMGDPGHLALELPEDLATAREAFEGLGISDGSRVVVTFSGRGVAAATRVLWTLEVLGLGERSSLLDGGNQAWVAAGGTLTRDVPTITPGAITARPRLDRRATRSFVAERGDAPGIALVDARTQASFDGVDEELPGRGGHIPGAGSLHFQELYDADMRLRPADELRALFERAGVRPGDTVVAYCHIGLWATNLVLAARTLGYDALLYDGSMHEWAADPALPLVTSPGR